MAACFRTNVLGAARLAQVAVDEGVKRVVMISSDKAVRPTSVMGVTKHIAAQHLGDVPGGAPNCRIPDFPLDSCLRSEVTFYRLSLG